MIRPDQIPDAVVEAAARMICRVEYGDELVWDVWIGAAEHAIAAALAAWPGTNGDIRAVNFMGFPVRALILPMPPEAPQERIDQESSDDA